MLGGRVKTENKQLRTQLELLSKQLVDANTRLSEITDGTIEQKLHESQRQAKERLNQIESLQAENQVLRERSERQQAAISRLREEFAEATKIRRQSSPSNSINEEDSKSRHATNDVQQPVSFDETSTNEQCNVDPRADADALLYHPIALKFARDSPMMQSQEKFAQKRIESLKQFSEQSAKLMREFVAKGQVFNKTGADIATILQQSRYEPWCRNIPALSLAMEQLARALNEIQSYQEVMLVSLQSCFSDKLERFASGAIGPALEQKKEADNLRNESDAALGRLLSVKRGVAPTAGTAGGSAAVAETIFDGSDVGSPSLNTTKGGALARGMAWLKEKREAMQPHKSPGLTPLNGPQSDDNQVKQIDLGKPNSSGTTVVGAALATRLAEAILAVRRAEAGRFELVRKFNLCELHKRTTLTDAVCGSLYAIRAYFDHMASVLHDNAGTVRALQTAAADAQIHTRETASSLQRLGSELQQSLARVYDIRTGSVGALTASLPNSNTTNSKLAVVTSDDTPANSAQVEQVSQELRSEGDMNATTADIHIPLDEIEVAVEASVAAFEQIFSLPVADAPESEESKSALSISDVVSTTVNETESDVNETEGEKRQDTLDGPESNSASHATGLNHSQITIDTEAQDNTQRMQNDVQSTGTETLADSGSDSSAPSFSHHSLSPTLVKVTQTINKADFAKRQGKAGSYNNDKIVQSINEPRAASVVQSTDDPHTIIKAGFLWKRSSGMLSQWQRRWFYIRDGKLWYIRNAEDMAPQLVCELVVANVREITGTGAGDEKSTRGVGISLDTAIASSHGNHTSHNEISNGISHAADLTSFSSSTAGLAGSDNMHKFSTGQQVRPYIFEIQTPARKPYLLQAVSRSQQRSWVTTLRKYAEDLLVSNQRANTRKRNCNTDNRLFNTTESDGRDRREGMMGGTGGTGGDSSNGTGTLAYDVTMRNLQEINIQCADCDARTPDWASINLGILLCLRCSGIHRSLGTHISKVRSITLDTWDPATVALMKALGNEHTNIIWEANVPSGWNKPTWQTARADVERWIRAKYEWKGFVNVEGMNAGYNSNALGDSGRSNDVNASPETSGNDVNTSDTSDNNVNTSGIEGLEKLDLKHRVVAQGAAALRRQHPPTLTTEMILSALGLVYHPSTNSNTFNTNNITDITDKSPIETCETVGTDRNGENEPKSQEIQPTIVGTNETREESESTILGTNEPSEDATSKSNSSFDISTAESTQSIVNLAMFACAAIGWVRGIQCCLALQGDCNYTWAPSHGTISIDRLPPKDEIPEGITTDISPVYIDGSTIVHAAAWSGCIAAVEITIQNGGKISTTNKQDKSPKEIAQIRLETESNDVSSFKAVYEWPTNRNWKGVIELFERKARDGIE